MYEHMAIDVHGEQLFGARVIYFGYMYLRNGCWYCIDLVKLATSKGKEQPSLRPQYVNPVNRIPILIPILISSIATPLQRYMQSEIFIVNTQNAVSRYVLTLSETLVTSPPAHDKL